MLVTSGVATIAVIDDDPSALLGVSSLVGSLGHEVESFQSARALFERGYSDFGCIVTDIQMPEMDGIALKLRLDAEGATIPVIMITARMEAVIRVRALAARPFCILEKPFDADTFVSCLARALAD